MSFITVKFGDDAEELFNPNCVTVNLLDNLRQRCGCQKGEGQGDVPTTYTALLNDLERLNPKLHARLEALSKSTSDSKQLLQRKESFWSTASKLRKLRGGLPSATERKRSDPISSSKADTKNIAMNLSPQGKNRQKKISKN
ncbi:hypothetical protein P5673_014517 [Acropora cervicornis]|uniref:Uncharacterized protein n=1 Tax=Acropora cervicornis TaxID=6130 RepID=A0AAD9QJV3_ACRCE|nr:hypothetical protein P5673_014517 [Acropora cervicornis]